VANTETKNEVKLTRKQIRDAAKKKERAKKKVVKTLIYTGVTILLVAVIGLGMFFSTYDPLRDNLKAAVTGVFSFPYDKDGHEDVSGERNIFPLDQASYYYFLNNYGQYMTEECCMELKDMVEYWNYWNKQKDYKVAPDEFEYRKSSDTTGYFETLLDITNKEGEFEGSVLMAGVFYYDKATNMITDINIDNESLLSLSEAYDEIVLGIEPEAEETTEETTEE